MKKRVFTVVIAIALLLLLGQVFVYSPIFGYKASAVRDDFPVPRNSIRFETDVENASITAHASYRIGRIGGKEEGLPEAYLSSIEEWGWTARDDLRVGGLLAFEKDDSIIWLIVESNKVTIAEMEEGQETP
ncbi:hypothetical protein N781_18295 [Pontibacillus halophilus JSM 076056 = DSM 19796]|uniref:Uncharacterized protein n=1 Tax=Pontibacillus halophilus JSM 076056 = DSM 19796 TaxID=1385510 RepID=A0A0A5GJV3_9BACI|nr:hypothetical protein [Pontibacillus halophilus]KGX92294.1 hypothetical protein N781_18295 [Pontibacillus halophilus JSM 076056 = DSM 19796]